MTTLETLKLANDLTSNLGLSSDETDWLIDFVRQSQNKTMVEFFGVGLLTVKPDDYPNLKTNNPWIKFSLSNRESKDFSKLLPYEITPHELHERLEEFVGYKSVFFPLFSDFTHIKKVLSEIDRFNLWCKVDFHGLDLDYAVVAFFQLGIKSKVAWQWLGDLAFDEYLTLFTEKEYDGRVFNEFIVTELKNNGLLNHPVIELIERIDDEVGSFVFDEAEWLKRVTMTMTAMKLKPEFQDYSWFNKVDEVLHDDNDYYVTWLNETKDSDEGSEMYDLNSVEVIDWWSDLFEEYN